MRLSFLFQMWSFNVQNWLELRYKCNNVRISANDWTTHVDKKPYKC